MSLRHAAGTRLALTILVSSCIVTVAAAQQPTPEQISAIRGVCRSDFMSRCSGVQSGGAEALACLREAIEGGSTKGPIWPEHILLWRVFFTRTGVHVA